MTKVTNISNGPRGAYLKGRLVMADAGQSINADDFAEEWFSKGKGDSSEAAEAPDYERDGLKDVDLHKPATTKPMLLVIAAYEGAEVPEGDDATKPDLIKAIELKRKG